MPLVRSEVHRGLQEVWLEQPSVIYDLCDVSLEGRIGSDVFEGVHGLLSGGEVESPRKPIVTSIAQATAGKAGWLEVSPRRPMVQIVRSKA